MTMVYDATDAEMIQAIYNCYPCEFSKFNAIVHFNRNGYFPFNPQLN
jgi:hypothetical protein